MNTFTKTHLTVPAVTAALITALLLTGCSGNSRGQAVWMTAIELYYK